MPVNDVSSVEHGIFALVCNIPFKKKKIGRSETCRGTFLSLGVLLVRTQSDRSVGGTKSARGIIGRSLRDSISSHSKI